MRIPRTILRLRKPRAMQGDGAGRIRPRSNAARPGCMPLELQPGPRQGVAGERYGDTDGSVSKSSLDRSSPVVVSRGAGRRQNARGCKWTPGFRRPDSIRRARNRPRRSGTTWVGLNGDSRTESTATSPFSKPAAGCSGLQLLCHRRLSPRGRLAAGTPRGGTRRPAVDPGNGRRSTRLRPPSASWGRGVSVPGVARPRVTATPPHLARGL